MSEAKRHRCPECRAYHMGFTEKCGDCLAEAGFRKSPVYGTEIVIPRLDSVGTAVTKSRVENVTTPLESVSHGGRRPGAGRKRKHASNAARLRAWRGKKA